VWSDAGEDGSTSTVAVDRRCGFGEGGGEESAAVERGIMKVGERSANRLQNRSGRCETVVAIDHGDDGRVADRRRHHAVLIGRRGRVTLGVLARGDGDGAMRSTRRAVTTPSSS
jgi:hypothetical protein